jgi:hypothetical protein
VDALGAALGSMLGSGDGDGVEPEVQAAKSSAAAAASEAKRSVCFMYSSSPEARVGPKARVLVPARCPLWVVPAPARGTGRWRTMALNPREDNSVVADAARGDGIEGRTAKRPQLPRVL